MQRIERLPFTTYDILGYLVPGMYVFVMLLHYRLHDLFAAQFGHFSSLSSFDVAVFLWVFVVGSFIVGHTIAYLSSLFTETLAVYAVGYPSEYLMCPQKMGSAEARRYIFGRIRKHNYHKKPGYFVICILFFPYTIVFATLVLIGLGKEFVKPLPNIAIISMPKHFRHKIGGDFFVDGGREWFFPIVHFCQNVIPSANLRMYNYLTIYGFLRHISFSSYVFGWLYLMAPYVKSCFGLSYGFSSSSINLYCGYSLLIVGFITFLGFLKFFRRFSEEAAMAFLLFRPS